MKGPMKRVKSGWWRCVCVSMLLWIASEALHSAALETIILWPNGAPNALGSEAKDIPTLTPYMPTVGTEKSDAAIIICPGGAYAHLSEREGKGYAEWLNGQGIKAFVLKYRLGSNGYRHPSMLLDAARAMRYVRANAAKWNIDPQKIGIMGSSAGGHLASTLLTHFDAGDPSAADLIDQSSSRPDFGILCYPVISMGPFAHSGSKANLLGTEPSPELVQNLSNELQVTGNTPPCFIWHTYEDTSVKIENSILFAQALRKAKVPFDLHIYTKGKHGLGLALEQQHPWSQDLLYWLKDSGYMTK